MLRKLALAVLSLVLALGALEIFLRVRFADRYYVWPPYWQRTMRPASIFSDDAHFTEEGARQLTAVVSKHLLSHEPLASERKDDPEATAR